MVVLSGTGKGNGLRNLRESCQHHESSSQRLGCSDSYPVAFLHLRLEDKPKNTARNSEQQELRKHDGNLLFLLPS